MKTYLSRSTVSFFWGTLSLVAVATVLFIGCGGGAPTAPVQSVTTATATSASSPTPSLTPIAVAYVKIVGKGGKYVFDPATLTIKAGTQVVWTNDSNAPHTVTSDTGVFNTPGNLTENQTFKVIFSKPGRYTYYCNIHTYMTGVIIVTS
jgi:plastocyanin